MANMAAELPAVFSGTEPNEWTDVRHSLALLDLQDLDDTKDNAETGFVSPRELTRINFQSFIGHTDEVFINKLLERNSA